MAYLLDAAVILLFLLAIYIGHRRGFIKTVTGVVAFLAALVVAALAAAPVAGWVYDTAVEPTLITAVDEQLAAQSAQAAVQADAAYNALPMAVQNLLAQRGIADGAALAEKLPSPEQTTLAENIVTVVRPILLPLVETACSLVLFFIAFILALILLHLLDIVAKLPLLKQLNTSLGFVGGIIAGILWAFLAVSLLQMGAALAAPDSAINLSVLNETHIVSRLAAVNPLGVTLAEFVK